MSKKTWSNYSDLTRPHPKWWFSKGKPLISGKSRLVKYYNLTRKNLTNFGDKVWSRPAESPGRNTGGNTPLFCLINGIGCFQKYGKTPQIIHFNRGFHYFHHPFWWFPPIFGNTQLFSPLLLTGFPGAHRPCLSLTFDLVKFLILVGFYHSPGCDVIFVASPHF